MKRVLIAAVLITSWTLGGLAQELPQVKRIRERAQRSIRTTEDAEHDRRLEESSRLPVPKAAVMNVDVQMVLSKANVKTFTEAKATEAKRVADGEPLWMYIKFKSKLGDYVVTTRNAEDPEKLDYTLYAEIAPKGDVTALHQITMQFKAEDLAATELKVSLAPAVFGRNKSIPILLLLTNTTKSGVWNNEFRLTNTVAMPRSLTSNLASTSVVLDFSTGSSKYQKLLSEYDSLVLRGTTDLAKAPLVGTYFSNDLKTRVTDRLAVENIFPLKIYFSGDHRQESASSAPVVTKSRRVFATFTYRQGEACRYGLAEIVENYDFMKSAYGEPEIRLQKDLPMDCAEAN